MIQTDKPSLSACAFGAGAAHAALLALALPVMVTLPASKDQAQGTVAIQVAVRIVPPSTFVQAAAAGAPALEAAPMGEGDVDDAAWSEPAPQELAPQEITGALPEIPAQDPATDAPDVLMEQAALSDPVEATPPSETTDPATAPDAALTESPPALAPEAEMELPAVASIESTEAPEPEAAAVMVPLPLRKPARVRVEEVQPKPAPRRRVTVQRTTRSSKPVFKGGLFGGRPAEPMAEFPFPAGR